MVDGLLQQNLDGNRLSAWGLHGERTGAGNLPSVVTEVIENDQKIVSLKVVGRCVACEAPLYSRSLIGVPDAEQNVIHVFHSVYRLRTGAGITGLYPGYAAVAEVPTATAA